MTGMYYGSSITFGNFTIDSGFVGYYVAKFNNLGECMWARRASASPENAYKGFDIEIDEDNNIYVSGQLGYYAHFETDTLFSLGQSSFNENFFIVKYDRNGNEKWVKLISGIYDTWIQDFDVRNNFIAITGYFNCPTLYFGTDSLIKIGQQYQSNAFVIKMNYDGDFIWGKNYSGISMNGENATAIAFDDSLNIYFGTSCRSDTIQFDSITVFDTYSNLVLCKLSPQGIAQWVVQSYGQPNNWELIRDIEFDGHDIVVYGDHSNSSMQFGGVTITIPPNQSSNIFLAKFGTNGNCIWLKNAQGNEGQGEDMILDKNGNIYIAGSYSEFTGIIYGNTTGINFGNNISLTDTFFSNDLFIAKYNTNGIAQWAMNAFSPSQTDCHSICLDNKNNAIVGGAFSGDKIIFGTDTCYDSGNSNMDIFLAKLTVPENLIDTQFIDLPQGWKIISGYIEPLEPNMDSIFAEISALITIVKNDNGQIYWPAFGINSIGDFSNKEGYLVKTSFPQMLKLCGIVVEPQYYPIPLVAGWQNISYPRTSSAIIDSMLSTVSANIIIGKNSYGDVFWPAYGINTIGNLNPGEGYQVKMNQASVLTYPAN